MKTVTAVVAVTAAAGVATGLWNLYLYYNRAEIAKRRLIARAGVIVHTVLDELTKVDDDEIEDVTDIVRSSVIDSVENTVVAKRRVRARAPFRAYLVKIGKAKFGRLKYGPANVLCVRKYLYDACIAHGVLARHINENVDIATEMVFVPTSTELVRLAIKHTQHVKDARAVEALLGDGSCDT
jgi:hypothetical protein